MFLSIFNDDFKCFKRSWIQHTGMQLATLSVLTSTFAVVIFVISLSMNLKRALATWGDAVQVTAYLREDSDDQAIAQLTKDISAMPDVAHVEFTPREKATAIFKSQMASYAPDLLSDPEFGNPFPASLRVALKGGVQSQDDLAKIEMISGQIGKMTGVEDVSYGQSWIHQYSQFVTAIASAGGFLIFILLIGGLFVVGNSVRAAISTRRDEIEILELVGATASYIRRPYVVEGFLMGSLAASFAIILDYAVHLWAKQTLLSSFSLARLSEILTFVDPLSIIGLIFIAGGIGALGAWLSVRRLNDGWAAAQRLEN